MNRYWVGTPNFNYGNDGRLFLFPHWTAGSFDSAVSTLTDPYRSASAHYVIEGDRVAQLVDEDDTAWHCGNYWYNHRSISYELVGWPGNPPSYKTLDTCAELMAQASRDYFGGARLVLGENVYLHRWTQATQCPGETDIEYLVNRANEILEGEDMPSAQEVANAVWSKDINGYSAGDRLYLDNKQLFDRTDYSGRGKDGVTPIERLSWMAAKQEKMQDSIDLLSKKIEKIIEAMDIKE